MGVVSSQIHLYPMLIIDSTDLSVYRVPPKALTNLNDSILPRAAIPFSIFERAALESFSAIILASWQSGNGGASFLGHCAASIVFVRLRNGTGYGWASRVHVQHKNEYPYLAKNQKLGSDFLMLWPVPIALHTYLGFKDRTRSGAIPLDGAAQMVLDHAPSLTHAGSSKPAFENEGKVAWADLSPAQRLFVASLAPELSPFAKRQLHDNWSDRLSEGCASSSSSLAASPSSPSSPSRQSGALRRNVPFDLPDELVGRIVCTRLAEDLCSIETAVVTVAQLGTVSRQFCACTRDALEVLLSRISWIGAAAISDFNGQPTYVQSMLWASCLTLYRAYRLDTHPTWYDYVRERRANPSLARRPSGPRDASKRLALLWDSKGPPPR